MRGSSSAGAVVITALAAGCLAGPTAAGESASKKAQFSEALSHAQADLSTPEGRAYDLTLSGYFARNNGPVLSACFRATPNGDKTSFEIAFRVGKDGAVKDARVWPETNIGLCVRDDLAKKTLPAPPKDDHWADLRVNFGQ